MLRQLATVEAGITYSNWNTGCRIVTYEPGNGYKYVVFIFWPVLTSTDYSQLNMPDKGLLLSLPELKKSTFLHEGMYIAGSWLADKLNLTVNDGVILAELVAHLTNCTAASCEEFTKVYRPIDPDDKGPTL